MIHHRPVRPNGGWWYGAIVVYAKILYSLPATLLGDAIRRDLNGKEKEDNIIDREHSYACSHVPDDRACG